MDPIHFDRLATALGSAASRRGALVSLVAGITTTLLPGSKTAGKRGHGKRKQHGRKQRKGKDRVGSQTASQCNNPGPGKPLRGCDFSGQDLTGVDWHSAMLRQAKFVDTNLCGADLHSAHLRDANLTDANLTRATLLSASFKGAKTAGAIFCQTIMPSGATDNSGCVDGATICCRSSECPVGETCQDAVCVPSMCSPSGDACFQPPSCSPSGACRCSPRVPSSAGNVCWGPDGQCAECVSDDDCSAFGPDYVCGVATCCGSGTACLQHCVPEL